LPNMAAYPTGSMASDLGPESIAGALRGGWGRPLRFFDEIGSTNSEALDWAGRGGPHGAVVVADHQSAGRGRRGRAWLSQPGVALQFSLVLRPAVSPERLEFLPTIVGVACALGVEAASGLPVAVKWPNDVTCESRKLAGVLVETRVAASQVEAAVVGIGINAGWRALPEAISGRATSVAAELERVGKGPPPSRPEILARVLWWLEALYPALVDRRIAERVAAIASERSEVLGRSVVVRLADGQTIRGLAVGLMASGALRMRTDGVEREVAAGEVERLLVS
jgi:BirA family transcriptional regulator, biotin operon repressor / biotin---[acetyl-CoA-carboxylase] ligase